MFGILERYLARQVMFTLLLVAMVLILITALITFVDKMRFIGRGDVDFAFLLGYIALKIPSMLVMLFPVIMLLSGVIALGNLARSSELVVLQSLGLSRAGIVLITIRLTAPLIAAVIAVGEFVVPPLEQYNEHRLDLVSSRGQLSATRHGLWLREGEAFISIRFALSDGSIQEITRYDFREQALQAITTARSGRHEGGAWDMRDVVRYAFTPEHITLSTSRQERWELALTPERIAIVGVRGMYLSFKGLYDYIGYLEENNQDAAKYRLELYSKAMMPLAMVVMLLLAASTVFGPLRTMSMGARVVSGIALGFVFYLATQIGSPIALVYGVPPVLGASLPVLLFMVLALWLLNRSA